MQYIHIYISLLLWSITMGRDHYGATVLFIFLPLAVPTRKICGKKKSWKYSARNSIEPRTRPGKSLLVCGGNRRDTTNIALQRWLHSTSAVFKSHSPRAGTREKCFSEVFMHARREEKNTLRKNIFVHVYTCVITDYNINSVLYTEKTYSSWFIKRPENFRSILKNCHIRVYEEKSVENSVWNRKGIESWR